MFGTVKLRVIIITFTNKYTMTSILWQVYYDKYYYDKYTMTSILWQVYYDKYTMTSNHFF